PSAVTRTTCPTVPSQSSSSTRPSADSSAIEHEAPSGEIEHTMLPLGEANSRASSSPSVGSSVRVGEVAVWDACALGLVAGGVAGSAVALAAALVGGGVSGPPRVARITTTSAITSTTSTATKARIAGLSRRRRDSLVISPLPSPCPPSAQQHHTVRAGLARARRRRPPPRPADDATSPQSADDAAPQPADDDTPRRSLRRRPGGSAEQLHRGRTSRDGAHPAAAACACACEQHARVLGAHSPGPALVLVLGPRPLQGPVEDVPAGHRELGLEVGRGAGLDGARARGGLGEAVAHGLGKHRVERGERRVEGRLS